LKANFTDVRISAMEDFVGRGDRRLAAVVRRAWELGAGMDAWWESLDRAFAAWTQAIAESNLSWKYRQVENGEWNLFQAGAEVGPEQAQPALDSANSLLDGPLPWDHLDTGIDKQWLKTDLERALAAATVPDCSFEGCSHCGVCGADFGHNVVVPPLPIPDFAGHFVPNQTRAQRLRVWFGKQDDMALISHLDLLRLFDRAIRRAALPISFTGGFHPTPRIAPASALSLGITSSGEIVDFDLTEALSEVEFEQRLTAQLPASLPVYRVEAVPLEAPSATQLLDQAEYRLTVRPVDGLPIEASQWQSWIAQVLTAAEIWIEQTSKSGKLRQVNLRERLYGLQYLALRPLQQADCPDGLECSVCELSYLGSCRSDGTVLRPEHVVYMLEQVAQTELQLLQIHRLRLVLV
ncbi:MAG: TIGR03936 family radical SAM-associated protein, partial [Elainella sp.]